MTTCKEIETSNKQMDREVNVSQEISADSSNPIASEGETARKRPNLIASETVIEMGSGERECRSLEEISENQSDPVVPDTVIEVRSAECLDAEGADSKAEGIALEKLEKTAEELKVDVLLADDQLSSEELIGGDSNGDSVCRICHVSSDREAGTSDLVELGCACKGELGAAHKLCAETWFKSKGNRCCEICGETVKNITGVGDIRFIEAWHEGRLSSTTGSRSCRIRCWQGHRICNFLMVCLVIAFILPWFFRVNMF